MNYLELLRWHNYKKCPYAGKCRKKFEGAIVQTKVKDGKIVGWYPSGEFLFHYQDTHGFPHEMMLEEFQKIMDSEMTTEDVALYNKIMKNHEPVPMGEKSFFERV